MSVYGRTIPITDDHLCAGGQYGKDACEGFGGAPLLVKHNDVHYQVRYQGHRKGKWRLMLGNMDCLIAGCIKGLGKGGLNNR